MSSDPPVKDLDDVIRWVAAHRAQTRERRTHADQRETDVNEGLKALGTRWDAMGVRINCLEKKVVRSTTIAAITGAGLGAAAVQLWRHYLMSGAI